jgi:uncharacterized protein YqjF (DUF2071 family)
MPTTPEHPAGPIRPDGLPVMRQSWGSLLFLHWPMPAEPLEALLPEGLQLDLYQGQAFIGVIPFTMWGVRPTFFPAVPGISAFHELNVRTYVRGGGVPGVWFFSLDASSPLAVYAARLTYHLPYYSANIRLEREDGVIRYESRRTHRNAPPATFRAQWRGGEPLPESRLGSLEHFLTERYSLYAEHRGRILRGRIHHPPWPLRRARLDALESTMIEALGLPTPDGDPRLHHADEIAVEVWPLESKAVAGRRSAVRGSTPVPSTRGRHTVPC